MHHPINDDKGSNMCDDIDGLLHDTFRNVEAELRHGEGDGEELPRDTKKFFMLASQIYQVFYIADSIEKDVYYARNKVLKDLYDLEEENCPNIGEIFLREPNDNLGPSTILDEGEFRWLREDEVIVVVDIPSTEEHSEDIAVETSEEEDEFDDTS
ncbi:hypothetical protein FXO38_23468 [Capsicum annuum]|nr:hypothetical protein FXO38_23468 [Capsicum annuum]KAF3655005.1 hypothetical protein FXO37_16186 [Capsicum annuum]